jgi:excisionase family DNA binding protein
MLLLMSKQQAPALKYEKLDVASNRTRIPVGSLRKWIEQGRLTAYRPGRCVLVRPDELDELIASCAKGAA